MFFIVAKIFLYSCEKIFCIEVSQRAAYICQKIFFIFVRIFFYSCEKIFFIEVSQRAVYICEKNCFIEVFQRAAIGYIIFPCP